MTHDDAAPSDRGRAHAMPWHGVGLNAALRRAALPLLAVASGAGWWLLLRWYGLFANRDNTHFAFEKLPGHWASPELRATLVLFVGLALVWAAGWWVLARRQRPSTLDRAAVVAFVAGPGIANLLIYPVGALDAFNYLLELKLAFHFGQNPYLVTFAGFRADAFALPAFLVDVPLFYGPAWLLVSGLPGLVAGYADPIALLLALKTLHLALVALTGWLLFRLAGGGRAGWLAAYLFAANPLVLFEGVGNAHNDVLVAVFLVAALAALRARSLLAGPALALSALVKFFTAALIPLFLAAAARDRWGWRRTATTTALAAAVGVALVAPFWAGGGMLDGLREGTRLSQKMDHVSPLSLAKQVAAARRGTLPADFPPRLPGDPCASPTTVAPATQASGALFGLPAAWQPCGRWPTTKGLQEAIERVALALFAGLALLVALAVRRGHPPEVGAAETMLLFALLATNFYSWYLIPVIAALAPAAARPSPARRHVVWLVAATALGLAYYPAYVFARFDAGWTTLGRHLFLALFLTVPALAYLGAAAVAGWRARRGAAAAPPDRAADALALSPAD